MTDIYEGDPSDFVKHHYYVEIERNSETEIVLSELWYSKGEDGFGVLDRIGGPAARYFDSVTGRLIEERWMDDGLLYRSRHDGPAVTYYDSVSGAVTREEYFLNGKRSNRGGPAIIEYDASGNITKEEFYEFRENCVEAEPPSPL